MKVSTPTGYQAELITRALKARRYTPRHRGLWSALYKQAALTVKTCKLSWTSEELVSYWLDLSNAIVPASEGNTIALDDLRTGFLTIAQESGTKVMPLESLEEFGDTWQEAPEKSAAERLESVMEWERDVRPVTQRNHLPSWCDGTSDPPKDDHLEPAQPVLMLID